MFRRLSYYAHYAFCVRFADPPIECAVAVFTYQLEMTRADRMRSTMIMGHFNPICDGPLMESSYLLVLCEDVGE